MFDRRLITYFNWPLLGTVAVLAIIGLVNLYSATSSFDDARVGNFFRQQFFWTIMGVTSLFFVTSFHYRFYQTLSYVFYGLMLVLLVAVLVFGRKINGNQSWIQIGPVTLQPSEMAKLALILALSRHLSNWPAKVKAGIVDLVPSFLLFLFPAALVLLQGDLGTGMFFVMIYVTMILVQGVRVRLLLVVALLGLALGLVSYFFVMSPHQKSRIVTFLNPEMDRKGSGYHLIQSKIAVGSGGWIGKGYLKGQSHKLKFIPERHTDFIFTVLAEEWGFVGACVTLAIYLLFFILGLQVAEKALDRFSYFMVMGICALFFWHLVVNLGGILGLMPLTGVPLPFFSYGGSALLTSWISVGLIINVSMRRFMFARSSSRALAV